MGSGTSGQTSDNGQPVPCFYVALRRGLRSFTLAMMLEYRPRPAPWRLMLVSGAQIAMVAWVATVLSQTTQTVLVGPSVLPALSAAALLLSLLILWLWPSGPSLASRMGVYNAAASVAAFGAIRMVERDLILAAASAGVAFMVCLAVFRRQLSLLGNVYDFNRLPVRLGVTLLAILPAIAVITLAALRAWEYGPIWCATVFGVAALLASLLRPRKRFEQLTRIELREPVAPLVIAFAVLAAIVAAWPDLIRFGIPLSPVVSLREILR